MQSTRASLAIKALGCLSFVSNQELITFWKVVTFRGPKNPSLEVGVPNVDADIVPGFTFHCAID
jgi:hypothetical protein